MTLQPVGITFQAGGMGSNDGSILGCVQVTLRASAFRQDDDTGGNPQYVYLDHLFDFTMPVVLQSFLQSGCYPLFIFVVVWSIAWPVIKLAYGLVVTDAQT